MVSKHFGLKKAFALSFVYLVLLLMYLPILVLIAFSFTTATNLGTWTGFSFDLYGALFNDAQIMAALGNTIIIALVSSVVSVFIGTLGAIGTFYAKRKIKGGLDLLTHIPVANPEIVIAMSLVVMFVFLGNYVFRDSIFSFWTLLIGHVILSAPFVYLSVKPKLQQMDPSLYEAALDCGCTPNRALRKVVLPQLVPGMLSGFLLSITLSLDDFIVTAFTRGPGLLSGSGQIETLSTLVQAEIKKGPIPPELRALTTVIFLVVLALVVGITLYQNRGKKHLHHKERRRRA